MPVMGFALSRFAFLIESASHSGVSVRGFSGPTNKRNTNIYNVFNDLS